VDVVEWSRALDVRLSEWCCSVTMVWVQIPSREEQKFDVYIYIYTTSEKPVNDQSYGVLDRYGITILYK
jgi:hypothetical protein